MDIEKDDGEIIRKHRDSKTIHWLLYLYKVCFKDPDKTDMELHRICMEEDKYEKTKQDRPH